MHSLFEIQHLSYAYHTMQGETPALSDITFTVNSGDFVAIVGPSGCGKSTLLNLLAGMLTPESGTLLLNGTPLTTDSRRHIGYMLQQDYLLEWRSIWKNVLLGLEIRHELTEESRTYAKQLLEKYGLEKFSQSKPSQLSGGMRQRAALVRTLVLKPELLLLDEPFSALDTITKSNIHKWYLNIMTHIDLSTLFITHDIDEAILLSDRIYILNGTPGEIKDEIVIREKKPRPDDFYLTETFLNYKRDIISRL